MSEGSEEAAGEGASGAAEGYRPNRPAILSLVCLFWASVTPLMVSMYLTPKKPFPESYGSAFVPVSVVCEILRFVGLLGIWWMRKFGVWIYTVATLVQLGLLLLIGAGNILPTVGFHVVNSITGWVFISRMR